MTDMKKTIALAFWLMAGTALAAPEFVNPTKGMTTEELLKKGREVVKDQIGQTNKIDTNRLPKQQVDLSANSPSMKGFSFSKEASKEFLDYATGEKKMSDPSARKYELFVAVSMSMPPDLIKAYTQQAREYGATLVLRGLHKNSLEETKRAVIPLNIGHVNFEVNPAVFTKFKITKVPSVVLADSVGSGVLEDGCAKEGEYLKVDGDASIHYALVMMKQVGEGHLASLAGKILENQNH